METSHISKDSGVPAPQKTDIQKLTHGYLPSLEHIPPKGSWEDSHVFSFAEVGVRYVFVSSFQIPCWSTRPRWQIPTHLVSGGHDVIIVHILHERPRHTRSPEFPGSGIKQIKHQLQLMQDMPIV